MYVTDSHSFLWFLTKDTRLGNKAMDIFRSCDRGETTIVIPSVTLLECFYLCEKRKVDMEFREIIEKTESSLNYPDYPLDREVVLVCQEIKTIKDLHDKAIVATARLLNARLITKDKEIRDSGLVETVW